MSQRVHTKPKVLFLAQTLPYPPHGGVKIRTFHTFRLLAESFDVTALCFYRWKGGAMEQDVGSSVEHLRRYAPLEAFPIPQEHSRARLVWDHARSVLSRRVYTRYVYDSAAYRSRIAELLRETRFDVVHLDSLDLAGYLPMLDGQRVTCSHHNVESVLLNRRSGFEKGRLRKVYLRHQAKLMAQEERSWCPRLALNLTCSVEDSALLQSIAIGSRVEVMPNGVDVENFRPAEAEEGGVVFVGGTTWFPNRDALAYFSEEILPLVRSHRPDLPVHWVGRASPEERRTIGRDHEITMTGYVDDIRPYVWNAACFVVPLRVGGGTRLKILDAWAMGKAVVSTSIGCEGLDATDGVNILIRDTPQAFADAVQQVVEDPNLRTRLGQAARETVERTYSWESIGTALVAHYRELIEANSRLAI